MLALMLHKYLLRFFVVDSTDVDEAIAFYNSFFFVEIVTGECREAVINETRIITGQICIENFREN